MRPTYRAALGAAFLLALPACNGDSKGNDNAKTDACGGQVSAATTHIFTELKPTCQGCHVSGARGYFASVTAFQSLLVADPKLVTPGKPDDSELVRVLEGRGTMAFVQMPPAGPSYAALVDQGQAKLSMKDIRDWIAALPAQTRDTRPDPAAPRLTRVSAMQVQRVLYDQLGLSNDDFFGPALEFSMVMAEPKNENDYPLLSPDAFPAPRQEATESRFLALGGAAAVRQLRSSPDLAPTFVHTLTQVSQRWCRMALTKQGNTALFVDGKAPSGTDAATVKPILKGWWRHFLAQTPTDADVEQVYQNVFVPLSTPDAEPAWVGSCSYFIRHPQWIFY